jgi:hypothetical protein
LGFRDGAVPLAYWNWLTVKNVYTDFCFGVQTVQAVLVDSDTDSG